MFSAAYHMEWHHAGFLADTQQHEVAVLRQKIAGAAILMTALDLVPWNPTEHVEGLVREYVQVWVDRLGENCQGSSSA
jgi:hypothetical protein